MIDYVKMIYGPTKESQHVTLKWIFPNGCGPMQHASRLRSMSDEMLEP